MISNKNNVAMSATRMQTYLTCKYKYWCNYILHLPRKDNLAFKLGISVHEALAVAGKIWKKNGKFTKASVKKIVNEYNSIAAKEGIANMSIYNEGLQMVLNKLNDFETGRIINVEDKFSVTTDEGVHIIGAMDKVTELNEESVLVVDYKTSKYIYTPTELKSDIQLSIYDLVASIKFPDYKRIVLCLDYLRDVPVYTYRTIKERTLFAKYLLSVYNEMVKLTEKEPQPSLNDMCSWCDFNDSCPAYQKALNNKGIVKHRLEDLDEENLIKKYLDIKSRKRLLDNEERRMKGYIIEKIKVDGQNLSGDGKVLYIRQNSFTDYDPTIVYENMSADDFLKLVNLSKTKVDAYIEDHPASRDKIIKTAVKGYKAPFLAYKKI